jgi:hypothetical protein
MAEIIAIIILGTSLLGIGVILFRKVPLLVELPEASERPFQETFWLKFKERIKNIPGLKSFSFEIFLQKLLSRIRVLTLKTDNKTSGWLQKLREKSQKEKSQEDDNYWKEIKKSTKE